MKSDHKLFLELAVVLLLVVFGFWSLNKNSDKVVSENDNTEVASTEDVSEGSVHVGAPAPSISYSEALLKYKDARIQLDKICQANPNNVTYKNNTSIMIDNRAPVARTVKVGSTFTIKAWGFKIVKLYSPTLPATWYVDCDKSQNVATILIQK